MSPPLLTISPHQPNQNSSGSNRETVRVHARLRLILRLWESLFWSYAGTYKHYLPLLTVVHFMTAVDLRSCWNQLKVYITNSRSHKVFSVWVERDRHRGNHVSTPSLHMTVDQFRVWQVCNRAEHSISSSSSSSLRSHYVMHYVSDPHQLLSRWTENTSNEAVSIIHLLWDSADCYWHRHCFYELFT